MRLKDRLELAIQLIVDHHERGLMVLDGSAAPSTDELAEVVRLANIDVPKDASPEMRRLMRAEEIEEVVGLVGGWQRIAGAAAYVRERYPESWTIFEEYVTFAEPGGVSHLEGESVIKRLSERHTLDKDTIVRRRRAIIYLIAKCAIMCPDRQLALPFAPKN